MIDENPIPQLIARHRVLTRQKKAVEAEIATVRAELKPLVEAHGEYTDASGYARITVRKPWVSYDGKAVDKLALAWVKSEDAVMRSCGDMILVNRKPHDGSQSLQVR